MQVRIFFYSHCKDPWSMGKWDVWGQILEPVTSKIPYMYAVGNHEYPCSFQGYRDR